MWFCLRIDPNSGESLRSDRCGFCFCAYFAKRRLPPAFGWMQLGIVMLDAAPIRLSLFAAAVSGLFLVAALWAGEKYAALPPLPEQARMPRPGTPQEAETQRETKAREEAKTGEAKTSGEAKTQQEGKTQQEAKAAEQSKTPEEAAYYEKFAEYRRLRGAFDTETAVYWTRIKDTRQARRKKRSGGEALVLADYVLDQPPVYRGPSAPVPPASLIKPRQPAGAPPEIRPLPVVADFLQHAKTHFAFAPDRPQAEIDFKRAYAEAALKAGINRDQAVRIYGFEAGGNGRHDVQAGLESPGAGRRAISTALGYNQLLTTNTISILADHGGSMIGALNDRLAGLPADRRARLAAKIETFRRMVRFTHTVPRAWSIQDKLARGARGQGLHALNLDIDIGPLLQAQKLADSIVFARRKGLGDRLTAAELEMMNLMGDGSGFDVVSMPQAFRGQVPTSNMFQRGGYDRNPVVRKFNTVAALLAATDAKMDGQAAMPGAKELEAAFDALGAPRTTGATDAPPPRQDGRTRLQQATE